MKSFVVFCSIISYVYSFNMYDYISNQADLSVLKELVDIAGLAGALQSPSINGTLLAPTNAAFNATNFNQTILDALKNDPAALQQVLVYHLLPQRLIDTDFTNGQSYITSFPGNNVTYLAGPPRFVDERGGISNVQVPNEQASNGVIHQIGSVLIPSSISFSPTTTTATGTTTASGTTTTSSGTTTTSSGTSTTSSGTTGSQTTGQPTTTGTSLPEQNAKAIQELQIRVTALERAIAECGCSASGKGKGSFGKGKGSSYGRRNYFGKSRRYFGNSRRNFGKSTRFGW